MTSPTPAHEEFKNEETRVIAERKPDCRVELSVHVSRPIIQKARRAAVKAVNKSISVAGFRKGKAPEELILKKYAPQVEKELQQQISEIAYVEAQKLARVPLLNHNAQVSSQIKKIDEEQAELSFSFEVEPLIPSVDFSQFERKPVERAPVSDLQIDEAIRQMLYFYAEWQPVEDRPIEDGDTIMINLESLEEDGYHKVFDHVRFEVSKDRMADWMKRLVQGAKAGDILEGMSEPDESASEQEKIEFRPKQVRLTLLKAERAILPTLDDEFAKKVGAPDVAAMRQSVSDLLNHQADGAVQDKLREQVNQFLIETHAFELPQSSIQAEVKYRFEEHTRDPDFVAYWEKASQEERNQFKAKLERESRNAIYLFYLSRKIVADHNLPITHKDIQNEAVATLRSFGARNTDTIPKETYSLAFSKVMLAKAQDYVLAQKA